MLYDHELMRQAERVVTLQDAKAMPGRVPGVKFKDLGGPPGVEGYMSNGSSISTTPSAQMDAISDKILAQLTVLAEGQASLTSKLKSQEASFSDRLNGLSSKMGRMGEGTPPDRRGDRTPTPVGSIECIACGKKGHKMSNCPDHKAFQSSREAAKDE